MYFRNTAACSILFYQKNPRKTNSCLVLTKQFKKNTLTMVFSRPIGHPIGAASDVKGKDYVDIMDHYVV